MGQSPRPANLMGTWPSFLAMPGGLTEWLAPKSTLCERRADSLVHLPVSTPLTSHPLDPAVDPPRYSNSVISSRVAQASTTSCTASTVLST